MRYPRVDIEELTAIAALAETGDFVKAGQLLNIGPSAVMKRLAKAERELQTRLFQRSDAKLVLTEDGSVYITEAQLALEHAVVAEERVRAAKNLREKRLRVGRSTHLPVRLLAALVRLDGEDIPGIMLEQVGGVDNEIALAVVNNTLHVGVSLLPVSVPHLASVKLVEEPLMLCLHQGHCLATKAEIRPEDLEGQPVIAVGRNELPALHEEVAEFYRGFGIELAIVADAYTVTEAFCLVEQRIGTCFLSRSAASLNHGIIPRPLSSKILTRKSGIIFHEDNQHPLVQSFISLIKERIQSRSG
jgi:DNA-binding transcriptional LysR family regulator